MTPSRTLLQLQSSYSHSDLMPNTQQMQIYHPSDAPPPTTMYPIYPNLNPITMTRHQSLLSQSHDPHTPRMNILELDQLQSEIFKNDDDEKQKGGVNYHHRYAQSNLSAMNRISSNKQLELHCFNNDIRAYNVWISCKHSDHSESIFFNALYPKLCQYFADIVGSNRYPTPSELLTVFIKHGAVANKTYFSIDRVRFMSFWNWFKACSAIIKELRYLWGTNALKKCQKSGIINGLGIDFFCQRGKCEENLLKSVEGTFGLRLSATICGGVVLSYVEHKYQDVHQKKKCKHVILIRQSPGMYLCNKKVMSLHDIIRNFVKLKFLYTPNRPIPKNKIF